MSEPEVEKLKERIAQLEQQLAEEREEFEWDRKAAAEAAAANITKLKEEIAVLRAGKVEGGADRAAAVDDQESVLRRALMAERTVAELQQELKRTQRLSAAQSTPATDSLMRQRAESAERERDELRREKRALERSVEEKARALKRTEEKAANTAELKRQLEEAKRTLVSRERELTRARELDASAAPQPGHEADRLRQKLEQTQQELAEKTELLQQNQAGQSERVDQVENLRAVEAERDQLKREISELHTRVEQSVESSEAMRQNQVQLESKVEQLKEALARTRFASGQMLEQREREAERLRNDLTAVQESQNTTDLRMGDLSSQFERTKERLERELRLVKLERDEAVSALRQLRESQAAESRASAPERQPTDGVGIPAAEPIPAAQGAQEDPAQWTERPAVPPEALAQGASDEGSSFPEAAPSDQAAGLREKVVKFSKGSTVHGVPPGPRASEVGSQAAPRASEVGSQAAEVAALSPKSVEDEDEVAEVIAPPPQRRPGEAKVGEGFDEMDELAKEWLDQGLMPDEVAQVGAREEDPLDLVDASDLLRDNEAPGPAVSTQASAPRLRTARAHTTPGAGSGKRVFFAAGGAIAGLGLIAGLVAFAWFLFPRWFGIAEVAEQAASPSGLRHPIGSKGSAASRVPAQPVEASSAVFTATNGTDAAAAADPKGSKSAGGPREADEKAPKKGVGQSKPPERAPKHLEPVGHNLLIRNANLPSRISSEQPPHQRSPERTGPAEAVADDKSRLPAGSQDLARLEKAHVRGLQLIRQKKYSQAFKHLIPWLKRAPNDAMLRYLYARALFYRRHVKAAVAQMQKAIDLEPDFLDAYYELGGMYWKLNKTTEARNALKKFLKLAPGDRRAPAVRRNLRKMRQR